MNQNVDMLNVKMSALKIIDNGNISRHSSYDYFTFKFLNNKSFKRFLLV